MGLDNILGRWVENSLEKKNWKEFGFHSFKNQNLGVCIQWKENNNC